MKKRKTFSVISALLLAALTVTGLCSCKSGKKEINLLTWEGYVPAEVVARFEADTNIKVNYSYFDTNEEMYDKILTQKNTYDVVICSDYIIDVMLKTGGALQKLDKSKLPNIVNVDPNFQTKYYDPDNEYSIPHAAGFPIIVYDTARVDFEIKGYKDFWNPALKNKVVLLDGARDIIGMALQTLGYSINETDPAKLEQAKQELFTLKPNIISFDANKPHEAIIRGDASVGFMFGSQATAAMEEVSTVTYVYPEENLAVAIDNYVLLEGAPHSEEAYTFMNYMLDGKTSANISELINYINCNTAAKPFLSEAFLNNKTVNVPSELFKTAENYQNIGDTQILYDEIWTEVKSK